jgi:hypothetical protein
LLREPEHDAPTRPLAEFLLLAMLQAGENSAWIARFDKHRLVNAATMRPTTTDADMAEKKSQPVLEST